MRTSELVKRVRELGYATDTSFKNSIVIKKYGACISRVVMDKLYQFDTVFAEYKEDEKLFNLLAEYAKTPIEERKEPKLYYARLKFPDILSYHRRKNYLNLLGENIHLNSGENRHGYITKHTAKWLREKGVWDNPDWEIVEVDTDEN